MPSQSRDTRENQKKSYDQRIEERRAYLEKKGITPKDYNKDKVYEHLKAKRRAIVNAIGAIEDINARNEHQKETAAEQAVPSSATSKEKKPKKEKPEKAERAVPAKTGD
jgi:hypothetical protein